MSGTVAEIQEFVKPDDRATMVSHMWDTYNTQRQEVVDGWRELRDYLFATDTTTTTNSRLPWKNTTTLPKLCQLRDNLHANYKSALFPNDNWLMWQGYGKEDSLISKRNAIRDYMANKLRHNKFTTVVDAALNDYIDYGNVFGFAGFEETYKQLPDGREVPDYIGPTADRISPLDIVFNPTADSFQDTHKIIRSLKSMGEIKKKAKENPEGNYWQKILDNRCHMRSKMAGYSREDFNKAIGYKADGFGNMYDYFQGEYVEILEFYGDYYDSTNDELYENYVITIADRSFTAREQTAPEWYAGGPIVHSVWRSRPDNLWGMGPLDNLVGLQYRIDHLENLKADAQDLMVHPPLKIYGGVESIVWGPGAEIHIDEGGDVREFDMDLNGVISANQEIQLIEQRMEMYAGAPREAMGIRSPGEKTAFEVQTLDNNASRIFQTRINQFEMEFLEPLLNMMLEQAQRNMNGRDVVRVMDESIGAEVFKEITANDITANGKLRPVGARHFAQKANSLQNLTQVFNTSIGQMVMPHTSAVELTRFLDDALQIHGYGIFKENAAIQEQQRTQESMMAAQGELEQQSMVNVQ